MIIWTFQVQSFGRRENVSSLGASYSLEEKNGRRQKSGDWFGRFDFGFWALESNLSMKFGIESAILRHS